MSEARLLDVDPRQRRVPVAQRDCWDCWLGTPGPTVGEAICGLGGQPHGHGILDGAVVRSDAQQCGFFGLNAEPGATA